MELTAEQRGIQEQFFADSPPAVVRLEIKKHWDALSDRQKLYAHHISRAAFNGTRIVLRQVSPESEALYDLILALHSDCNGDWSKYTTDPPPSSSAANARSEIVTQESLTYFLEFATHFLGSAGNYRGFGDTQILLRCAPAQLDALIEQSPRARQIRDSINRSRSSPSLVSSPTSETAAHLIGLDVGQGAEPIPAYAAFFGNLGKPATLHLGFPDQGHVSGYFPGSDPISKAEIEAVGKWMGKSKEEGGGGLLPENTRLRKVDKEKRFEVLVSSQEMAGPPDEKPGQLYKNVDGLPSDYSLEVVYGDHAVEMGRIAGHMLQASQFADNDNREKMVQEYVKSFKSGSLEAFKESQKRWVKDVGPDVETNIGFIETYRDPAGVRAEWEGFVAMVNKERTEAFSKLVKLAPVMIPKLPWGEEFEKETFQAPDFTSLEVLTFVSSGIPAGINIPNYDDIRQNVGFKNVSLGNVLSAKAPDEKIPFIHESDLKVFAANRDEAFEVQVGIHELLGHGTGKLLQETSPGKYNFDHAKPPMNPITEEPVDTWYKPGETWSSVFGALSSSYEECRAECCAMALCCDFSILKIFGLGDGTPDLLGPAGDVLYASYLSMARAGVVALEFWDPKARKWGQAHMQARYSILQVFLQAGNGFCKLDYADKEALSDLTVRIDRQQIPTTGRRAIEDYLRKLHVFKSTADVKRGTELYEGLTSVDEWWATKVRPAVLKKKTPRKVFVMGNTTIDKDGKVQLKEYEATLEGMIRSWAERDV